MRVLMTGGGTGGHVNPALAIANTIKVNIPGSEIAFVGTKRGLENELVPKAGYPLYHVDVRGFRRSFSVRNLFANIRAAYLAEVSPLKAKKLIREFRPDIVIGTGGYACWPVLVAASRMGIPTAVHESNAVPGLAVRKLEPYVDRIFTNFAVSAETLTAKEKVMQVGCPLLGTFGTVSRDEARKKLGIPDECKYYIVSFGGSLGAERMNSAALELMEGYVASHPEVTYVHATGSDNYEAIRQRFVAAGLDKYPNITLVDYIYDMPLRMAAADLIISRAGAITLSELSREGKASILIPSPNVTDNQQYKNAKVLSDGGGAILIEEKELGGGRIVAETAALLEDPEKLEQMRRNVSAFSPQDANKLIYDEIRRLVSEYASRNKEKTRKTNTKTEKRNEK